MEYVTRRPILAFQYNRESINDLPDWIEEKSGAAPTKTTTDSLMIVSHQSGPFGAAHTTIDPGEYLVFMAGQFEKFSARQFEETFIPVSAAD